MDSVKKITPSAPPLEEVTRQLENMCPPKYDEYPPSYEEACKHDKPPPYRCIYPWAELIALEKEIFP